MVVLALGDPKLLFLPEDAREELVEEKERDNRDRRQGADKWEPGWAAGALQPGAAGQSRGVGGVAVVVGVVQAMVPEGHFTARCHFNERDDRAPR